MNKQPTKAKKRIDLLDIYRGFAILGIFVVNIVIMNSTFLNQDEFAKQWTSNIDQLTEKVLQLFFLYQVFPNILLTIWIGNFYAIGEIVLVVIGILIALQINNWNESQKLAAKEFSIAKELYLELNENIASVTNQLELWQNRDTTILKLSKILAEPEITINQREFDSLLIYVIAFDNFKLKQSKFNRIIASESFEFKKSKKIITKMLELKDSYNTLMAYYQFNADNYHDVIQPYLLENYRFRNFSNVVDGKRTDDTFDFKVLLADYKFDNLIQSARGNNAPFVHYIKNSLKKMEALKEQLETVYPGINPM